MFALVLRFTFLCVFYIINVIYCDAISSSFKARLYLNVLLYRIILRLWYVSFAHETLKCLLPQNFKICNMKPYYNSEFCFICLVTMVISI